MATPDTETRTALQELLDERQRYEAWLRALDQRRTSTPTHVYERVHTDYTLRLERVMERLRERAEQLSATIEGLQSRLQALRSREAERTDERQEYELRASVGELSPEEWERRRTEADRELGSMADDRRQIEQELAELERIVAMTRGAPAEREVPIAHAEPVATQPPQPAPEPESTPEPAPVASNSAWDAPPSFVLSFAPRTAEREQAPVRAPAPAPAPAHDAPSTAGEHPLASSNAGSPSIDDFVAEWPLRHMATEAPAAAAADVNAPSSAPATATWHPPAPNTDQVTASPQPSPAPSAPEPTSADLHHHPVGDGRRDMDKTLKCPECGAMNYATEWYCERCGGELASF